MGHQIDAGNEEVDEMDQEGVVGGYEESGMKTEVNDERFACMRGCMNYMMLTCSLECALS